MLSDLEVVHKITELLAAKMTRLKQEESRPCFSADESDAHMKELRNSIERLKEIRATLEDILT